jgi:AcrR family transcriptional regulator
MKKREVTTKPRLTREDWIEAGTAQLVMKSIDSVRVEPLAELLSVSRGSFYWHFKSRVELLDAILATWRDRQTSRIIERLREDLSLTPAERLVRLRSLQTETKRGKDAAALELSIRAWARRDKNAKRVVEEVDRERINVVRSLLIDSGMPAELADRWSIISYAFTVGESLIRENLPEEQRKLCRDTLMEAQFQSMNERGRKVR